MSRIKEQKIKVYLTNDQQMELMRDYDQSGMNVQEVCQKYGISKATLYNYKKNLWSIYQSTKESMNSVQKIATINAVKIDHSREQALLTKKATSVMHKILDLMDYKLDIEEQRLRGEVELDEKIAVNDLTRFFQAAAPYLMQPIQQDNDAETGILKKKHSHIVNILQQQFNIKNNDTENNN